MVHEVIEKKAKMISRIANYFKHNIFVTKIDTLFLFPTTDFTVQHICSLLIDFPCKSTPPRKCIIPFPNIDTQSIIGPHTFQTIGARRRPLSLSARNATKTGGLV